MLNSIFVDTDAAARLSSIQYCSDVIFKSSCANIGQNPITAVINMNSILFMTTIILESLSITSRSRYLHMQVAVGIRLGVNFRGCYRRNCRILLVINRSV